MQCCPVACTEDPVLYLLIAEIRQVRTPDRVLSFHRMDKGRNSVPLLRRALLRGTLAFCCFDNFRVECN
jgi:hypothetical protein